MNNAMHAKSGLRVVLKWKIYRPDSVIAAVIPLKRTDMKNFALLAAVAMPFVGLIVSMLFC